MIASSGENHKRLRKSLSSLIASDSLFVRQIHGAYFISEITRLMWSCGWQRRHNRRATNLPSKQVRVMRKVRAPRAISLIFITLEKSCKSQLGMNCFCFCLGCWLCAWKQTNLNHSRQQKRLMNHESFGQAPCEFLWTIALPFWIKLFLERFPSRELIQRGKEITLERRCDFQAPSFEIEVYDCGSSSSICFERRVLSNYLASNLNYLFWEIEKADRSLMRSSPMKFENNTCLASRNRMRKSIQLEIKSPLAFPTDFVRESSRNKLRIARLQF